MSDLKFDTVGRALEWLESQEPDEILEVMKDYPGLPGVMNHCPLALYCKETTGIANVSVALTAVATMGNVYPLGEKLQDFRVKFDKGEYPHLEFIFRV